jgi:predicted ATP-dependent endonuclease of OLD family
VFLTYEDLVNECNNQNIQIFDKHFKSKAKGLIKNNRIAIRKDIPTLKEKSCILAEELGHYYTSVGNILDLQYTSNKKQEYRARLWAYNKQIGLSGIVQAYEAKCRSLYEIAEYLDITEDFLQEALNVYRSKYGIYTKYSNYIIYFEPNIGVMKLFSNN